MNIHDLYSDTNLHTFFDNIEIDSRKVKKNTLFICIKGHEYDGHDFIKEAIDNGAVLIITEKKIDCDFPFLIVENTKKELIKIIHFYYKPNDLLNLIGITGTDGKTTTASYIYYLFQFFKKNISYIGTNGIEYNNYQEPLVNTTPDLLFLAKKINELKNLECEYLSLEVSAQSITEERIKDLKFKYKVFTNFSHEHLEYYLTLDDYFFAKKSFFSDDSINILNLDDPKTKEIIEDNNLTNIITFGTNYNSDFLIIDISIKEQYSLFSFKYKNKYYKDIFINVNKIYNVYNIIPAIIIGLEENILMKDILLFLKIIPKIKGRYETITKDDFKIIVDFAHTPNGLYNLINNEKLITPNKKFKIVIGAGGNKDKSKRSLIGKILFDNLDYIYFTSEDPKNENPLEIIKDIIGTNIYNPKYEIIIDRKKAIKKAIDDAKNNETIFITGKGLENFQKINNNSIYHNDYEFALSFLNKKSHN